MLAILRPWSTDDAHALLTGAAIPDLATQLPAEVVGNEGTGTAVRDFLAHLAEPAGTRMVRAIAVGRAGSGPRTGTAATTAVGNVAITGIDDRHRTGWVSYWLLPEARGRGLARRALATLTRWAFEERGLERLELGHRVNNPASCAVASGAGFAPEGVERGKLLYDGVRYDVETHALLHTDPRPAVEHLRLVPAAPSPAEAR